MGDATLEPQLPDTLRERRALLASVLGILRFMEGLQDSLEAVQTLGDNSRQVPTSAQKFFGGLDKGLASTESPKLRIYLERLEQLIKQDLTRVLRIAGADRRAAGRPGEPPPEAPLPEESELVDEFRRRALTIVSLRTLLRKRGQPVGAVVLPVPEKLLKETLDQLAVQRDAHRERALGEALLLRSDLDRQLQNEKLPKGMRASLEEMREGLVANIAHLRAGKPVAELPMPMESSEVSDTEGPFASRGPAALPEKAPALEASAESQRPPAPAAESGQTETTASPRPRGLLSRAWMYLTTGPQVGWKDTAAPEAGTPSGQAQ